MWWFSFAVRLQFANWVDAVIFVFSVEDDQSFEDVYSYYAKMAGYRAAGMDVPVIVVGTQGKKLETNLLCSSFF
jgi:hypothetical protein